jgi:hypothetical protein
VQNVFGHPFSLILKDIHRALLPPSFPLSTDFDNTKPSDFVVVQTRLSLGFGSNEKQSST